MLLNEIRIKANEVYTKYLLNNENSYYNLNDKLIFEKIINILKDDNCFLKITIDLALQILIKIGYSKEDAKRIYVELVNSNKKNIEGTYSFIDL